MGAVCLSQAYALFICKNLLAVLLANDAEGAKELCLFQQNHVKSFILSYLS